MSSVRWDALERAIAAEDRRRALAVALEGWRVERHPRFADLVDAFGSTEPFTLAADHPEPGSLNPTPFHQAWIEGVATAEDIGPYLATLTTSLPMPPSRHHWERGSNARRHASWLARVEALAKRPDDPRIATALVDVLTTAPWTASFPEDAVAVAEPAVNLVVRIGDPRVVPRLRELLERPIAKRRTMRDFYARAFPDAIAAIRDVPMDPEALARVEQILGPNTTSATSASSDEALFALVVADLENDAPRAVLADHWLERGNVRGELVMRQLAGDQARGLSRKHDKDWIGDLALVTKNRVYRRGFLAEIELLNNAAADRTIWASATKARDLATVEAVHKGKANEELYRSFLRAAPALRLLTATTKKMGLELAASPEPWPITHLAMDFPVDAKIAKVIAASPAFPRLEEVTLGVKVGAKLVLTAKVFADRGVERVRVWPIWLREPLATLAELVASPVVKERWIRIGHDEWFIARDGLKIEIISEYVRGVRELLGALLAANITIDEIALRLPPGVESPHPLRDHRAFDGLRGVRVVPDAGWAKEL